MGRVDRAHSPITILIGRCSAGSATLKSAFPVDAPVEGFPGLAMETEYVAVRESAQRRSCPDPVADQIHSFERSFAVAVEKPFVQLPIERYRLTGRKGT